MNLTHDNVTQPITEWAADFGIPADLIELRILAGWTTADAIETEMETEPFAVQADRNRLEANVRRKLEAKAAAKREERDLRLLARMERQIEARKAKAKSRRQTFLTHNGETLSVQQWAKKIGVKPVTIYARIKHGHTIDRVLSPNDHRAEFKGTKPTIYITHDGQTRSLSEWSTMTGIKIFTLRNRHRLGLSATRILDPRLNVRPEINKPSCRNVYISAQGERLTLAEWSRRTGIKAATLKARILIQGMSGDEAVTKPVRPGGRRKASTGGVGRASDVNAGTGALPTAQISAELGFFQ